MTFPDDDELNARCVRCDTTVRDYRATYLEDMAGAFHGPYHEDCARRTLCEHPTWADPHDLIT